MNRAIFFVFMFILAGVSSLLFYNQLDNVSQTKVPVIIQGNLDIAERALQIQNYSMAAEAYGATLALDPKNKQAELGVQKAWLKDDLAGGDSYLNALQFTDAINAYERASLISPASTQTQVRLTWAEQANACADYINWLRPKAQQADEILKQLDNDHPQFLLDGANGYAAQPDVDRMIALLQQLQQQSSGYALKPQFRQVHASLMSYVNSLLTGMYAVNGYLQYAPYSANAPGALAKIKTDFTHSRVLAGVFMKQLQATAAKDHVTLQEYSIKSFQP